MKSVLMYVLLLTIAVAGCKKDNYPGGQISPYIAIYDVRNLYKGEAVTLSEDNMFGSTSIAAMVVTDHSGGNMPTGIVCVQDKRRLNELRGIAINLGADASKFTAGDSVIIDLRGAKLEKMGAMLHVTGVGTDKIRKVASGVNIPVNKVASNAILADPAKYESTLVAIVKAGFNPLPAPNETLAGDKVLNDGFGNITMHTEAGASFASMPAPFSSNYYGIIFNAENSSKTLIPQLRMRTGNDVQILSSTIEVTPVVITGYMADALGGDGNFEYVQLMATKDINFATTPFSVVFTNNANASTPTGYPAQGWATGGMRTYKINLTTGTALKGTYFYVGGNGKLINGSGSTNIASANWIKAYDYVNLNGEGFGTKTGGLLANSGNASGIAVFETTTVTVTTKPVDVVFIATGGSLFTAGPPAQGYLIGNTDFYDVKNPLPPLDSQPYYRAGTNTMSFIYNTGQGFFNVLGGEYNPALGRWTRARSQNPIQLTASSLLSDIESVDATKLAP